jgi:molecular chaperone HscB
MANPFETLGLAPSFAIDPLRLEQRQRELNRAVHPDRHAGKSSAERRQALSRAMDINLAYRTLRDPASRAVALLEVLGDGTSDDAASSDLSLLSEMLEQRERLEEARRERDLTRLHELAAAMAVREQRVLGDLETAFASVLGAAPEGPERAVSLTEARRLLSELRYVRRFSEEVSAIEDEL